MATQKTETGEWLYGIETTVTKWTFKKLFQVISKLCEIGEDKLSYDKTHGYISVKKLNAHHSGVALVAEDIPKDLKKLMVKEFKKVGCTFGTEKIKNGGYYVYVSNKNPEIIEKALNSVKKRIETKKIQDVSNRESLETIMKNYQDRSIAHESQELKREKSHERDL